MKHGCNIKDRWNGGPGFVLNCAFHNHEETWLDQKLCTWIEMRHVRALTLARKGGVRASEKTLKVISYLRRVSSKLNCEANNISQFCIMLRQRFCQNAPNLSYFIMPNITAKSIGLFGSSWRLFLLLGISDSCSVFPALCSAAAVLGFDLQSRMKDRV